MILKFLAIIFVWFLVYIIFFKKNREKDIISKNQNKKKKEEKIEDEMVECPTCKIYISKKDATLSNAHFYCSKDCLLDK